MNAQTRTCPRPIASEIWCRSARSPGSESQLNLAAHLCEHAHELRDAVSKDILGCVDQVDPASSAVWIIRIDSEWSMFPMAPSIMVPSASSLTEMPVPPSVLRFILVLFPPSLRPRYSSARPRELGLAGQPVRRVWRKRAPAAWMWALHPAASRAMRTCTGTPCRCPALSYQQRQFAAARNARWI